MFIILATFYFFHLFFILFSKTENKKTLAIFCRCERGTIEIISAVTTAFADCRRELERLRQKHNNNQHSTIQHTPDIHISHFYKTQNMIVMFLAQSKCLSQKHCK